MAYSSFKKTVLILFCTSALSIYSFSQESRWTFDGHIHNNSLAISPNGELAVACLSQSPEVIVYQLDTKKVKKVLNHFITPRNIIFHPNGNYFYISDSSLGVIEKIDIQKFKTVSRLSVGPGAFGTAISKDGSTLYVNNKAANTVTVFDLINERPKTVITGFSEPRQGVRLSPDGKTLFVTNFQSDKVTLVDTSTNKIIDEISNFNKIRAITVSKDGKTLYAGNSGKNTIAVVDIPSRKIVKEIRVGKDPYGATLTPDERHLYSGNRGDNTLSVIELSSQKVVATVPGLNEPRQAIIFGSNENYAWVLNKDLSISQVNTKDNKVSSVIFPSLK